MDVDWSLNLPNVNEIAIHDEAAERQALAEIEPGVAILGYKLANVRVTMLGNVKFVRVDIVNENDGFRTGYAVSVMTKDQIDVRIMID